MSPSSKKDTPEEDAITKLLRQEKRMQDMLEPPGMRGAMEAAKRMQDMLEPPGMRGAMETAKRMQDMLEPPGMRGAMEAAKRMQDMLEPPGLRGAMEAAKRMQDMLEPPALRGMLDSMATIRDYATIVEREWGPLRLAEEKARRTFEFEEKARRTFELEERARRAFDAHRLVLPDSASLAAATAFSRSVQLFGAGAVAIEAALRNAHLEREATMAAFAAAGISKLGSSVSHPTFEPVAGLLGDALRVLDPSFEDATVDLAAHVPSEVFRSLDLDRLPTRETADLVGDERVGLAQATSDEVLSALACLDPGLLQLLDGARGAVSSPNPDRARHFCVSLRELIGHVLRQLAPDDQIKAWTQDSSHFDKGRPTRRARLEYLYSLVAVDSLRTFVSSDIRAALDLIDLLSNGTHVVDLGTDATALTILLNRAEGVLSLLITLNSARRAGV
jgi:hypothetical protein